MTIKPIDRQPESKRTAAMPDEKRCPGCGQTKPWHQFGLNVSMPNGLTYRCMECERAYQKRWRDAKAAKDDTVRKAHKKTRDAMLPQKVDPPPPPAATLNVAQMFQMFAAQEAPADDAELRLRYELAAHVLSGQQELLRLLLAPRRDE